MRTRVEKYHRYRAKIAAMPENKFPKRAISEQATTHADQEIISHSSKSSGAIDYQALPVKKNKATPYALYSRKKRIWLIIKSVGFVIAIIVFVLLYFFWVKG
jgi:hypothetical protein